MTQDEKLQPIDDDPVLGRYIDHFPSNRFRLTIQGSLMYAIPIVILQWVVPDVEGVIAFAVIAVFALVALTVGWYILHLWNREIILFEKGFTYREGSAVTYFHYHEIISIRQKAERVSYLGLYTDKQFEYTMRSDHGEQLKVNNIYNRIDQLGILLERRIAQVRKPIVEAHLQRGENVTFGEQLTLNPHGLLLATGDQLVWADFVGYRVASGQLQLQGRNIDNWAQIRLNDLENIGLLLLLLKERTPPTVEPESASIAS